MSMICCIGCSFVVGTFDDQLNVGFVDLNQVEGGGEPFNHDHDYNKEVMIRWMMMVLTMVMMMLLMMMMILMTMMICDLREHDLCG